MGVGEAWRALGRPGWLQRGPARRPGWAAPPRRATGSGQPRFNEARPGGRDGRSTPTPSWPSCSSFNEARPGGRDGRIEAKIARTRLQSLQRGPARRPGWACPGCSRCHRDNVGFNEARPGGRDGRLLYEQRYPDLPPLQRGPARRPGWAAGPDRGGRAVLLQASTRPGPEAGMGGERGSRPRRRDGSFNEARPGGRDGRSLSVGPSAHLFLLQRGPARRPGWAIHELDPAAAAGLLQRGPARRPGWAHRLAVGVQLLRLRLQRGPARRPGWAPPGHHGRDGPGLASTRPGPEAGMGEVLVEGVAHRLDASTRPGPEAGMGVDEVKR